MKNSLFAFLRRPWRSKFANAGNKTYARLERREAFSDILSGRESEILAAFSASEVAVRGNLARKVMAENEAIAEPRKAGHCF